MNISEKAQMVLMAGLFGAIAIAVLIFSDDETLRVWAWIGIGLAAVGVAGLLTARFENTDN